MKCLTLVALAACSHTSSPAVDGAPEVDASTIDGPPATGMITVTINNGQPVVGADVVFTDRSGTPYAHVMTDAAGMVAQLITAGDSVIAIQNEDTFHMINTIIGVQPGDALVLGYVDLGATTSKTTIMKVPSAYPNANRDLLSNGCGDIDIGTMTSGSLVLFPNCVTSAGQYNALAVASNNSGPLAFSYLKHLTPPATASVTLTLPAWRTDFASLQLTASNAPPHTNYLSADTYTRDDGLYVDNETAVTPVTTPASTTFAVKLVPGLASDLLVHLYAEQDYSVGRSTLDFERGMSATTLPTTITADYGNTLPVLHDLVVTIPAGDNRPQIGWTSDGSTANAIGGHFDLQWQTATDQWEEVVVVSGGTTSPVQLPHLPAELAMHGVAAGQAFSEAEVRFAIADDLTPASYRQVETNQGSGRSGLHTQLTSAVQVYP